MICVTVAEATVEDCLEALKGLSFAEIRMDMMKLTGKDVPIIFRGSGPRLIATCRLGTYSEEERKGLLIAAVEAGASYVDVEVESNDEFKDEIVRHARTGNCQVIVSFHDFEKTPDREELLGVVARCFSSGADIAKIACKAESERDVARLLGLLDSRDRIVVIGMGEKGSITRIVAPLLGSPFTYGALRKGKEVVDGQLDVETIGRGMESLGRYGARTIGPAAKAGGRRT